MLIRCGYDIKLTFQEPTAMVCLLSLHRHQLGSTLLGETSFTSPQTQVSTYVDYASNRCMRLIAPAGDFMLWGDATIETKGEPDTVDWVAQEVEVADLPSDCLIYLMGSRYCETDRLSQFAWDRFGMLAPGWGRVQAICDFVQRHIRFDYLQARSTRSAFDVFNESVGVCRDYAHLAIAFCRCLNIPARYVNGHLGDIGVPVVDPMDFSAWMEVFLGGRWHTFDPRNNAARIGRIVVARGRDAADVPLINSFKPHALKSFRVWTYEVEDLGQLVD